jgi:hypothetical protein
MTGRPCSPARLCRTRPLGAGERNQGVKWSDRTTASGAAIVEEKVTERSGQIHRGQTLEENLTLWVELEPDRSPAGVSLRSATPIRRTSRSKTLLNRRSIAASSWTGKDRSS